jgi:hypothetical protein
MAGSRVRGLLKRLPPSPNLPHMGNAFTNTFQ